MKDNSPSRGRRNRIFEKVIQQHVIKLKALTWVSFEHSSYLNTYLCFRRGSESGQSPQLERAAYRELHRYGQE